MLEFLKEIDNVLRKLFSSPSCSKKAIFIFIHETCPTLFSTKLALYLTLDVGDLVQTICPGSGPILRLLGANGLVVYCALSGADTVWKWKHSVRTAPDLCIVYWSIGRIVCEEMIWGEGRDKEN